MEKQRRYCAKCLKEHLVLADSKYDIVKAKVHWERRKKIIEKRQRLWDSLPQQEKERRCAIYAIAILKTFREVANVPIDMNKFNTQGILVNKDFNSKKRVEGFLQANKENAYSIPEVAKELGIREYKVNNLLMLLRKEGKVVKKRVGLEYFWGLSEKRFVPAPKFDVAKFVPAICKRCNKTFSRPKNQRARKICDNCKGVQA